MRRAGFIGLFVWLAAGVTQAGVGVWTTSGPEGGAVSTLAVDPADPSIVYSGTAYAGFGLLQSTDSAASWKPIAVGLGDSIAAIAIDPKSPSTVLFSSGSRIFKTTDSGRTWSQIGSIAGTPFPGRSSYLGSLMVDPAATGAVFAGGVVSVDPYTASSEIYRSTDGGSSWSRVFSLLTNQYPPGSSNTFVSILVNRASPEEPLYASVNGIVYRSVDGGASWVAGTPGLAVLATSLVQATSGPATLYAGTAQGVFKSTDRAATWTAINDGLPATAVIDSVLVDPVDPSIVYVATGAGLYRSTDAGSHWALADSGIHGALTSDPRGTSTLYSSAGLAGVSKSTDAGASWILVNHGLVSTDVRGALVLDDAAPGTVYAGGATVFKSTDDGVTWSGASGFEEADLVFDIVIDPSDHQRLYAGTGYGGIYRSVDAGSHWAPMNSPGFPAYRWVPSLAVDPLAPATLWAVSNDSHLHRSKDGGQTWVVVDTTALGSGVKIAFDPFNPRVLCYGTSAGMAVSLDSGTTWSLAAPTGGVIPLVFPIAFDPLSPSTIYAASSDRLYRSLDSGQTWNVVGLPPGASTILSLVVDPTRSATLYLAANFTVLKSIDGGGSWVPFANGLIPQSELTLGTGAMQLAINKGGTRIFNATGGQGVWTYEVLVNPTILSLSPTPGRGFSITLAAMDQRTGRTGAGVATQVNDLWGYFSIPAITNNPNNPEVFVKMLDGTALNGSYWFFYGGLTDLEYVLTVTEVSTGRQKTYTKPAGSECGGSDTEAFGP